MQAFPTSESTFLLSGPIGNLEILATPSLEPSSSRPAVAIICHPHPLYGGTMHNKVVSTLARAFGNLGLRTVRFNFRGVGKSEGAFADGVGEREDLLAVVEWVRRTCPQYDIWLAGFSFGAAVSAHVATEISVARLVSIAPPVPRFDLLNLKSVACPWLIVQGEEDDVVVPGDVYAWVESLEPRPELIRVAGAGHFFHGRLLELRNLLERVLALGQDS